MKMLMTVGVLAAGVIALAQQPQAPAGRTGRQGRSGGPAPGSVLPLGQPGPNLAPGKSPEQGVAPGPGQFRVVRSMAVDSTDRLYVIYRENNRRRQRLSGS